MLLWWGAAANTPQAEGALQRCQPFRKTGGNSQDDLRLSGAGLYFWVLRALQAPAKAIVETLHCEALFELRKKCTTVTTVSVFTRGSFDLFVPICIQHFPSPRIPPSCLRRGRGQEDVRGDEPGHRLSGHLQDAHAIGCVAHIRLDTHHEVEADKHQGACPRALGSSATEEDGAQIMGRSTFTTSSAQFDHETWRLRSRKWSHIPWFDAKAKSSYRIFWRPFNDTFKPIVPK